LVHEIAIITIDPAHAAEFEEAVAQARPHFEAAKGFVSFALARSIEYPERYRLAVGWDSVEAHMVDFRQSNGFLRWRALVGPFFKAPPSVEHVIQVM